MDLQRKIRRAGHNVIVTLPSQLAELAGLEEGDVVEFEYLGRGACASPRSRSGSCDEILL